MNRRWLITIGIIVLALIVIGVLYEKGLLNFEWQELTMIFAALAGPYAFIKGKLIKDKRAMEILKKQEVRIENEAVHRSVTDEAIEEKQKKIELLNKELELAEKRIEIIEMKKKNVDKEVKEMTVEELQDEAVNYFGS